MSNNRTLLLLHVCKDTHKLLINELPCVQSVETKLTVPYIKAACAAAGVEHDRLVGFVMLEGKGYYAAEPAIETAFEAAKQHEDDTVDLTAAIQQIVAEDVAVVAGEDDSHDTWTCPTCRYKNKFSPHGVIEICESCNQPSDFLGGSI